MAKKIYISEKQMQFLKENKGLLFEYYEIVSDPKRDAHILGDIQVWIYGNDRQDFTPHCHVMTKDKSVEFEVSLLDWSILNIKKPQNLPNNWNVITHLRKPFFKWLMSFSKRAQMLNKRYLFAVWDGNNPNNQLEDYVEDHQISVTDSTLLKYLQELND